VANQSMALNGALIKKHGPADLGNKHKHHVFGHNAVSSGYAQPRHRQDFTTKPTRGNRLRAISSHLHGQVQQHPILLSHQIINKKNQHPVTPSGFAYQSSQPTQAPAPPRLTPTPFFPDFCAPVDASTSQLLSRPSSSSQPLSLLYYLPYHFIV